MSIALVIAASVALALECPDGTRPLTVPVSGGGAERYCAKPSGQPHGDGEILSVDGRVLSRGAWLDGAKHGAWRLYRDTGQSWQTGSYAHGARVGPWTTLGADGEPVATVFHGALGEGWSAGRASKDARVRWQTVAAEGLPAVEVVEDAVLMRQGTRLAAVSPDTGAVAWSLADPSGWRSGAVVAGDHAAAVTRSGLVVVADLESGRTRGIRTGRGASDVLDVDADTVWVRDGAGRLAAWRVETGEAAWVSRQSVEPVAPVAVGRVVVGSRGRELYAVRADTGAKAWGARLDATVVALAGGFGGDSVLALTATGGVQRFDAADGAPGATLSPERPRSVGAGAWIREEEGGVVLGLGDQVRRIAAGSGSLRVAVEGLGPTADLHGEVACGGVGGLSCRLGASGAFVEDLPPVPVAGPVVVLDSVVVVPTADRLVAVDPLGGTPSGEGGEMLVRVRASADATPTEGLVPYDVVDRFGETGDCMHTEAVVDLRSARALLPPELAGSAIVELPELEIAWSDHDPEWRFAEGWEPDRIAGRWDVSWSSWWRPELEAVVPVDGSPQAAAALDHLLTCDGPGATFRGQVLAHDTRRRLVLEGMVQLEPFPHEVEGLAGCLVDLWVDGEDYGPFRPFGQSGWMDTHVSIDGVVDAPEPPEAGLPLPAVVEAGVLTVETLFPGELARREVVVDAPVAVERADGWPTGLDAVLIDGSGAGGLDPVVARMSIEDLVLLDAPEHTEWWSVTRTMALDAWDEGPRVVWSLSDCPVAPAGTEAAAPEEAEPAP